LHSSLAAELQNLTKTIYEHGQQNQKVKRQNNLLHSYDMVVKGDKTITQKVQKSKQNNCHMYCAVIMQRIFRRIQVSTTACLRVLGAVLVFTKRVVSIPAEHLLLSLR